MRFVTWNCRVGGFRKKASRMAPLMPDILVVPEVERLDGELFLDGAQQPTFLDRQAKPELLRGIGVFSYTGIELKRAFAEDGQLQGFAPYTARRGDLKFQVIAVWTLDTGVAKTSYRQAHDGLERYREWIQQAPTVVLGDFNITEKYKGGGAWRDLIALAAPLGLVSAYHHSTGEHPGEEKLPTYFHRGSDDAPWHIDYCFLPEQWIGHLRKVEVGAHDEWRAVSDHAPLIVDVDV